MSRNTRFVCYFWATIFICAIFHAYYISGFTEGPNDFHYNYHTTNQCNTYRHPWWRGKVIFITIVTSNQCKISSQSLMEGQNDHLWLYSTINALWSEGTVTEQSIVCECVEMLLNTWCMIIVMNMIWPLRQGLILTTKKTMKLVILPLRQGFRWCFPFILI